MRSVVNDGCCATLGVGHNGVCATLQDIHNLALSVFRVACGLLLVIICRGGGGKVDYSGATNCGRTHGEQRKGHLAGGCPNRQSND